MGTKKPQDPREQQETKEEVLQKPIDTHDEGHCFICTEKIEWFATGECNHPLCHTCCLRLRGLYKKLDCAYCKSDLKTVLFVSTPANYDAFMPRNMQMDKKLGIYFESSAIYDIAMNLLRFNCPEKHCGQSFSGGWPELKQHVKKTHQSQLCEVCTQNKKAFTHEHILYNTTTLRAHNKEEHPNCQFCVISFYGIDELYEHMGKNHEQCFICQRNDVRNQYFADYRRLEDHFNKEHYTCQNPKCLELKFVVFDSEIDFQAHELEAHADAKQKARGIPIQLDFDYRSASNNRDIVSRDSRQKAKRSGQPTRTQASGSGSQNSNPDSQRNTSDNDVMASSRTMNPPPGFGSQLSVSPLRAPASPVLNRPRPPVGNSAAPISVSSRPASPVAFQEPTPAEMRALSQSETIAVQPHTPILNGDPTTVRAVEKLVGTSLENIAQFKLIVSNFRKNLIDAPYFLDCLIELSMMGRLESSRKSVLSDLGRLWHRLADTLPESDTRDVNITEAISKIASKKKKRGLTMSEFEALRLGTPKKDSMLSAWNDFKAHDRQDRDFAPVRGESYSSASVPGSIPRAPQTAARALSKPGIQQSSSTTPLGGRSIPSMISRNSLFPELPPPSKPARVTAAMLRGETIVRSDPQLWGQQQAADVEQPAAKSNKKKGKNVTLLKWG